MISRRTFLNRSIACSLLTQLPALSFAAVDSESRLVLVILRGALDGLTVVPPYGDRDYADARRELAIMAPGKSGGALELDTTFGLHPSLKQLHQRFQRRELAVIHAVASPYRERSHFDGQNVLENGTPQPSGGTSGWLNRAIAAIPSGASRGQHELGVALGQNVPLVLRGDQRVTSWAPSLLPEVEPDTLTRLADLYAADPVLAMRLNEATAIDALADAQMGTDRSAAKAGRPGAGNIARLKLMANTAGKFLVAADGPRIAVFDATGWDTHAQEGAATGQLAQRLDSLDAVLDTLVTALQPAWQHSVIMVVTEFGRTVALNGTRGTDHGTGTCAFVLGGAVNGGRVIADWPGLSARALYEGRDLKPTTDLRAVFKGVLQQHYGIGSRALDDSIFPSSAGAAPISGLLRA